MTCPAVCLPSSGAYRWMPLEPEVTGTTVVAGRPGVRITGSPRELDPNVHTPVLPRGADLHELVVDMGFGVVLRRASFVDGAPFSVTEILEVRFDEPIPPETFVFTPPPGVLVRPAGEVFRGPMGGPGGPPAPG